MTSGNLSEHAECRDTGGCSPDCPWNAYPEDECEGAPEPEEPCSRRCGYVSSGRDLIEHEIHEHKPCPDCGNGPEQDLRTYSLAHKPDCPRLEPGYAYPEESR